MPPPPLAKREPRTHIKDGIRREQRDWLRRVVSESGLKPSAFARKAGVSDTTLTRFLNDEGYEGALTPITMAKLQAFVEQAAPPATGAMAAGAPLEAAPWTPDDAHGAAVQALIAGRVDARPFRVETDALHLAGLRVGDLAIVDMRETPRAGDMVCAQIEIGMGARTVFRLFQPPYLVAAANDPTAYRPEIVDGERVRIAGVVTESLRWRA